MFAMMLHDSKLDQLMKHNIHFLPLNVHLQVLVTTVQTEHKSSNIKTPCN